MSFTWTEGRRLSTVTTDMGTTTYQYNADGLRTSKTFGNGNKVDYYWLDGTLQAEVGPYHRTTYLYDENSSIYGFLYESEELQGYFFYVFNLQGDVIGIINNSGDLVVEYTYDAWGNVTETSGVLEPTLGQINPIRYRGYYYDEETGLYYLNSRYYDAKVGRFLNADSALYNDILGYNLFGYCNNNPTNSCDLTGENAEAIWGTWTSSMWWLTLIDGFLPIGDVIYWGVASIVSVVAINGISSSVKKNNTKDSDKDDNNKRPVVKPGQQPTKDDGYIAPKDGPIKGKTKDGKTGWKDKNGNIWVPAPTGSNSAHGGGHWDVQSPKGGYVNVYPGGTIRGGKAPYPKIPIFP